MFFWKLDTRLLCFSCHWLQPTSFYSQVRPSISHVWCEIYSQVIPAEDNLKHPISSSSLTAAVTCIIGLQYGHILANVQVRLHCYLSASIVLFNGKELLVKICLVFIIVFGDHANKNLFIYNCYIFRIQGGDYVAGCCFQFHYSS